MNITELKLNEIACISGGKRKVRRASDESWYGRQVVKAVVPLALFVGAYLLWPKSEGVMGTQVGLDSEAVAKRGTVGIIFSRRNGTAFWSILCGSTGLLTALYNFA